MDSSEGPVVSKVELWSIGVKKVCSMKNTGVSNFPSPGTFNFPLQSHKKLARANGRLTDSPKFARREEVGTDVEREHFRNFSILVSPAETHASRYQFDQQPIGTRRLENF